MKKILSGAIIAVIVIALAAAAVVGFGSVSSGTSLRSVTAAEDAARRSAALCYAVEGRYPESIEYLAQNYGLYMNNEKYVYHYRFLGDNLMPEIAVFRITAND